MNRDIKFRAWCLIGFDDADNEKLGMVESEDLAFEDYAPLSDLLKDTEDCCFMQYTGIKDKDGKEIYEGDIVEYERVTFAWKGESPTPPKHNGVIEWWSGQTGIGWRYRSGRFTMMLKIGHLYRIKVIGNVFENPELLESDYEEE